MNSRSHAKAATTCSGLPRLANGDTH